MRSRGMSGTPRKIQIFKAMVNELKFRKHLTVFGELQRGAPSQFICFQVFKVRDLEVNEQSGLGLAG